MTVSVTVPEDYNLEQIAANAGQPSDDQRWYMDGKLFVNGPTQQALDDAVAAYALTHAANLLLRQQNQAKQIIDSAAGRARERYATTTPGQAETYIEKGEEAADFVVAGYPADLTAYPFIRAEVNATGKTATQAADDILARRSAWIAVGASIEQERIGGKIAVDAATDIAGVEAARDAAIAALDSI